MTSTLPPPPTRPTPQPRRRSPGIWIGVGLVALGGIVAVVWIGARIPAFRDRVDEMYRADAETPASFVVEEDVSWDLFIEPSSRSQSGLRYQLVDEAGEVVALGRSGGSSYDWFGDSGREIATADLAPGRYRLEVTAGDATVAIGRDPTGVITGAIAAALIIGLPLVLGGTALAIVSAIRDTRRRTRTAAPPPPSPWSAGEWPAEPGR
ncbi:MAG: hypothetical protein R8F63_10800 [Acidimicrobiales bacterium]|nr:hypothetical protein [Acidimicrobiales bacterium]